jgi:hypothetical protein
MEDMADSTSESEGSDFSDVDEYESESEGDEADYDESDARAAIALIGCAEEEYDAKGGKWKRAMPSVVDFDFEGARAYHGRELHSELDCFKAIITDDLIGM